MRGLTEDAEALHLLRLVADGVLAETRVGPGRFRYSPFPELNFPTQRPRSWSALVGGLAGYLIAISQQQVTPFFGLWATIKGLMAMIIGGMGSIPGAIVGGMLLGVVEIQAGWFLGSEFQDLVAYFLLFVFLIVRPAGLFGAPGSEEWASQAQRA